MFMYANICYKKTFLKEVILRVDFPSPLPGLEKALPPSIANAILKKFPIAEPQKVQSREFQFSDQNFQANSKEVTKWVFHGKEREKTITVLPESIVITTKNYKTYEDFVDNIHSVLDAFYKEYKDLGANRIGLRYVNVVDPDEGNPLSWNDYIEEKILGIIDFHDGQYLTRIFHILEYNYDGQAIKFQFGISNPDYPALIKRKQFVLDIDSYFHGTFTLTEIMDNIVQAHEKIQELFEKSITKKTKDLMEPIDHA